MVCEDAMRILRLRILKAWHIAVHSLAAVALAKTGGVYADTSSLLIEDGGFESESAKIFPWTAVQHAGVRAYEMTRDTDIFFEGKQSLRVRRVAPQIYGSVRQVARSLKPGRYRFSAHLRSKEVDGRGWYVYVSVLKQDGAFDIHSGEPLLGTQDWRYSKIEFVAPVDAVAIELGVSLHGGGTAWIDNALLEVLPARNEENGQ
jgi:hypothetical protein